MSAELRRVVYLYGAGATQAELSRVGDTPLLIGDINEGVFDTTGAEIKRRFFPHADSRHLNIEYVISLIESLGTGENESAASDLRRHFQKFILDKLRVDPGYVEPNLTKALLKFHKLPEIGTKEKLLGIMTLNYDSLLDIAFSSIYGNVNYGIQCNSEDYTISTDAATPPLLKLYGSFNWQMGNPIKVLESKDFLDQCTSLWIPPSIYKRTESYPFNYIWGKAFEILDCDVLRVVGCSLNQNDWGLLTLLFKTQFIQKDESYNIELINKPLLSDELSKRFGFLKKMVGIEDIPDVKVVNKETEFEEGEYTGSAKNWFEEWLKAKIKSYDHDIQDGPHREDINSLMGENIL